MWAPAHVGLCIGVLHGGWLEGPVPWILKRGSGMECCSCNQLLLQHHAGATRSDWLLVQHSMPSAEAFGHGLCSMPLACCVMKDSTRQGVHMHAVSGPSYDDASLRRARRRTGR